MACFFSWFCFTHFTHFTTTTTTNTTDGFTLQYCVYALLISSIQSLGLGWTGGLSS